MSTLYGGRGREAVTAVAAAPLNAVDDEDGLDMTEGDGLAANRVCTAAVLALVGGEWQCGSWCEV